MPHWLKVRGFPSTPKVIPISSGSLSKEEKEVQDRAWNYFKENSAQLVSEYLRINGSTLDADRAKDLFPEYAITLECRIKYASAVYEPAQQIVDQAFLGLVESRSAKGKTVIFTAGGPGAGKSSFMFTLEEEFKDAVVIMDGTLADRVRAQINIELALQHGCLVAIYYMHRRFEDCVQGVIDRALSSTSGRTVPMRVVATKYFGAIHTVQALAREFKNEPRVLIEIKRFVSQGEPAENGTLGEVIRDTPNSLDQLIRKAYLIVNERYHSAQQRGESFPRKTYERLASHAPSFKGPRR